MHQYIMVLRKKGIKKKKKKQMGTEEEFNPEKDNMLCIDEDEMVMFEDMKDVN